MIKFRNLVEDEIECRVQQVQENGLILLLYKNARCDMNILDETVGAENWQREHYECKGNLFCRVGICCTVHIDMSGNDGDILSPSWVWKSDCGAESNTEKEKGEASDSFKRACVNWGIGRELYTAPFIWISSKDTKGKDNYKSYTKNGKLATKDKFVVERIVITEEKKITGVSIVNATQNKRVFVWSTPNGN
jgi:hypothetical protein